MHEFSLIFSHSKQFKLYLFLKYFHTVFREKKSQAAGYKTNRNKILLASSIIFDAAWTDFMTWFVGELYEKKKDSMKLRLWEDKID